MVCAPDELSLSFRDGRSHAVDTALGLPKPPHREGRIAEACAEWSRDRKVTRALNESRSQSRHVACADGIRSSEEGYIMPGR